ncbi:hypothetical protein DFS34DRAFT_649907 [Phlyctochytrium arcticum]|nr:hypothetical protein DFS34DRAFT_649907 [Phlyctochytrium arcticum]
MQAARHSRCPEAVDELVDKVCVGNNVATVIANAVDAPGMENKDVHWAGAVLFDFWASEKFSPNGGVAYRGERRFIITRLGPLLNHFERTFSVLRFEWIEKHADGTKDISHLNGATGPATYAVDILGKSTHYSKMVFVEVDGEPVRIVAPEDYTNTFAEAIDGLRYRLAHLLDAPIHSISEIRSFGIHISQYHMTLVAVSLTGPNEFTGLELKTADIPKSWPEVDCYQEVFDMLFFLKDAVAEQARVERRVRAIIRDRIPGETDVRQWLNSAVSAKEEQ